MTLIISALLVVGGFFALLLPQDFTFARATNFPRVRQKTLIERASTRQSRVYGLVAVFAGVGLATYVLWASRTS